MILLMRDRRGEKVGKNIVTLMSSAQFFFGMPECIQNSIVKFMMITIIIDLIRHTTTGIQQDIILKYIQEQYNN